MPTDTSSPIPAPPIITRAGWGVNECIRDSGYPDYGQQVKVVFVHHTDDPNTYACSNSAALVRAAYLYHVQVEGWRDIGYNFLVDKCGQIFEGRFGGTALPVVGAQTYGFNTNSMGIAAIGTYTDLSGGDATASPNPGATPTDAMLRSIAWIAAWKLDMSGIDPITGTNVLTEGGTLSTNLQKYANGKPVTFHAISGHRDGYNTDCPGNQLYNDLVQIRAYAENPITYIDGGAIHYNNSEWITRSTATVHWATAIPTGKISGFDVLVDGVSHAHTDATTSQASITLTGNGPHQIQVQTDLASGASVKSAAAPVVLDTTAPAFPTLPAVSLRTGTVSGSAVPVLLNWRAADNIALTTVGATAPTTASFGTTATTWSTYAKPGTADLFALRATDEVGNVGTASVLRTPRFAFAGSGSRAGSWSYWKSSAYLGGYAYSSGTRGASISFTFTGRSVAWIATRAHWAGQAYVYVDGSYVQRVDLYNSTTLNRQAVWAKTWSTTGRHTVKIVVVGTSGRPNVPTEGIATLA
jgi:hypothetical protein